ncbi:MAG: translation elongation factor 4 [Candidatus Kuenenbacteria bacterium]
MENIRNFCIIAHIDHGKSTLADRLLELTGTIEKRKMKAQVLDQMDLERERGITIKLQPARMKYEYLDKEYILNLIDTPGHVDFSYEVSRSLAAVEGALLIIDATQGIQAQTLANLYLAMDAGLEIIPILNKIDLPAADIRKVSKEVIDLLGCKKEDILSVSAKTGQGVGEVLKAIINRVPSQEEKQRDSSSAKSGSEQGLLQALIFDSKFDDYKGVIAYVRVVNGDLKPGGEIRFLGAEADSEIIEVGYFSPYMEKSNQLLTGEIGYVVTGLKNISDCRVGDTISNTGAQNFVPLPGYKEVKSMVFAGLFCKEGSDYKKLREALAKLKLTDASLIYEPESSPALGFGFRCGFLGLLHLEIIQERLKREYDLDLIITVPSVAYRVYYKDKDNPLTIHSPQELGKPGLIDKIEEPWVKVDIVTPKEYLGNIMTLVAEKRGEHENTEYLSENSAILHYEIPLSSILTDFYDKLKSATKGYASLNYELLDYRQAKVERLDIIVAEELIDALATIIYSDSAYSSGKKIVNGLKDILPRQMFEVKIQACLGYQDTGKNKGGKIIASARIPAMRKDVTAKLYGGDVTRKRKLLEKQKKGKKKMKSIGKVDIPGEAYIAVLKR